MRLRLFCIDFQSRKLKAMWLLPLIATCCFSLADAVHQSGTGGSLKKLSLEQLGDVEVVAASKEPEEIWQTPAAISVITQEDIRRMGATSIPEILRRVPGLQVARTDSNSWAVGVRGFASQFSKSVLVMIDGRNVYTPLFAGVNWRLQNVLLDDIDRIEVIRGPGGTVWGTNAVNGVVNIITKNSKETSGALVTLGGGNVDRGTGGFRLGATLGRNLAYRVYGMAFDRGPEYHPDRDNFDAWQLGQGGFRLDLGGQKGTAITLQGDLYKGSIGEKENIAFYSPPASINIEKAEEVSGGNLLMQWRHEMPSGSDIRVQAYYDRTYRLGSQLGETRNTFDIDFTHHLKGLRRQEIIWGLGARWSPSTFKQTVATVDFQPHHQSDNVYSVFVQDQLTLRNDLWLTVGSKFEHNIYTGWEIQPAARLTWTPGSYQTVWAAVTRAVRSPARLDVDLQLTGLLTTNPLPIFITAAGNPKFVSETLLGYELGYRRLVTTGFYVDVSMFHNDHDHLTSFGTITTSFESTPPPLHAVLTAPLANGIKGHSDGVEISPDWRATSWLELRSSYSYLNLSLENKLGYADPVTIQSDEGSSPRHQLNVQAILSLPKGFELDPAYRYVTRLRAQSPSGQPAEYVRAYNTMDVRAGWHVARAFDLSVYGHDLLQPSHAEFGGDPGPLVGIKRGIYAQVKWTR
jgi:iron complex outermembrane recepter protein